MELTLRCQLQCEHCYTNSSPTAPNSNLTLDEQLRAVSDAAASGVTMVQFIGGEPTLNSDLPTLIEHAVALGLEVELYSNLYALTPRVWAALDLPGVVLATSYYTTDPAVHDAITTRAGSHRRTRSNIARAIERGVALRVGIIEVDRRQDIDAAIEDLMSLGVTADLIKVDRTREVGRGSPDGHPCGEDDALCGGCANGVVALLADGTVKPCVFARDDRYSVGNLGATGLAQVLNGPRLAAERERLGRVFASRADFVTGSSRGLINECSPSTPCNPVSHDSPCAPHVGCSPDQSSTNMECSPSTPCSPVSHDSPCAPHVGCSPDQSSVRACTPREEECTPTWRYVPPSL
jgi:MoaA/NifB/PqqE/SkfB family radical SAM enzyme